MSSLPLCVVMLSIAKHPVTVLIALSSRPCAGISLHITLRNVIPVLCRDQLAHYPSQCHPGLVPGSAYTVSITDTYPFAKTHSFFSLQKVNNFHFVDPPVSLRFSIFAANDSKIHHNSTSPDVRAHFG